MSQVLKIIARAENPGTKTKPLGNNPTLIVNLVQGFLHGCKNSDDIDQSLYALRTILEHAAELFIFEETVLSEFNDGGGYEKQYRNGMHKQEHLKILLNIEHGIRQAADSTMQSAAQDSETLSCLRHCLDPLIKHLALERHSRNRGTPLAFSAIN
jgi:hemerythrin